MSTKKYCFVPEPYKNISVYCRRNNGRIVNIRRILIDKLNFHYLSLYGHKWSLLGIGYAVGINKLLGLSKRTFISHSLYMTNMGRHVC